MLRKTSQELTVFILLYPSWEVFIPVLKKAILLLVAKIIFWVIIFSSSIVIQAINQPVVVFRKSTWDNKFHRYEVERHLIFESSYV